MIHDLLIKGSENGGYSDLGMKILVSSRNLKTGSCNASNALGNIDTIPQTTSAYFFRYFSYLPYGPSIWSLSYNWCLCNAATRTTNRNFPYLRIFGSKDNSSVQDI